MTTGLMIMASRQTFFGQFKDLTSQTKFGQSDFSFSMGKSLN